MRKNNKRVLGILALLLAFGQLSAVQPAQAATPVVNDAKQTAPQPQAPTVIEADQVYFSEKTGEMFARGNVKITQNQDIILTDYMRGNQQQTTIWVDGSATLLQPNNQLTTNGLTYNYNAKTGTADQVRGVLTSVKDQDADALPGTSPKVRNEYLTGQKVQIAPGYLEAHDATYTGCELPNPDYHISADKVELWPGDKLIAHNAKFWIKDTVIFTLPRYELSLKGSEQGAAFPKLGYSSDNGVSISQNLSYPFNPNLQVYTNLAYYSKAGFRPQYGIKWDKSSYYLQVESGDYYDSDDDVWLEKRPEYKFGIPRRRIGNLPLSYQFTALYGKWSDDDKTSWHQEYSVYFTGDTISLDKNKTLNLSLGTGWKHIHESLDDSTNTVWKYDATLSKQWSPKLNTFVANHYSESYESPFSYSKPDLDNELAYGVSYSLNDRHTISYKQSYDLDNSEVYSRTYGWDYSMHCWLLDVNYTKYTDDSRDDRFSVKINTNF